MEHDGMPHERCVWLPPCGRLSLVVIGLLATQAMATQTVPVEGPSLARLSFWVAPERMADFERAYVEAIVPLLARHRLVPSAQSGRATVDSVFSRLFEFSNAAALLTAKQALVEDTLFAATRRQLGEYGAIGADSVRSVFRNYDVTAGPGATVRAGAGARRGDWHSYTMVDGLPSQNIINLAQGPDGALWGGAAYFGQLFRYDGGSIRVYSAEDGLSSRVNEIQKDRAGNLWITWLDEGGVSRFDGKRFVSYGLEDGLAGNEVSAMMEDPAGDFWFATDRGVSRLDESGFVSVFGMETLGRVSAMFSDSRGAIWFGSYWDGLARYDGDEIRKFTAADGLPSEADDDGRTRYGIEGIAETANGDLWFGSCCGLIRFDGTSFSILTVTDGLVALDVNDLAIDGDDNLWVAAWGGVSRFDGEEFDNFTTADGLPQSLVRAVIEDDTDNLWVATGGGLTRFVGKQFVNFTTEQALMSGGVMSIGQDKSGTLWFGAWNGMSRFDGRRFTTSDSLAAVGQTWEIFEDSRGRLWFGGFQGGLLRYLEEGQLAAFRTPGGSLLHNVRTIVEDPAGNLWFGGRPWGADTSGVGLRRYDGKEIREFTTANGLAHDDVSDLLLEGEYLWISTDGGGVSRYDGQEFVNFTTADGLADDGVWRLALDSRGDLWAGTRKGVSRFDGDSWVTYTRDDGLAGDFVFSIMEDRRGTMWFGHWDGGVTRYDGTVFQTLRMGDGLIHDAVQNLFEDDQGNIWIATEGGITRYHPTTTRPGIEIVNVVGDRDYGVVHDVRLPSTQNYLAFECLGSSFNTPAQRLIYAYRLQGLESEWRWSRNPRIVYNDVPHGDYVFQVKAVDRDLNYSESAAEIRLAIHADYGRIALAGGLGLALCGMVLASGYGVRRRRERDVTRQALGHEQRQRLVTQHRLEPAMPMGKRDWQLDDFVESSAAMQRLLAQIGTLREQPATRVLLLGEVGTGKQRLVQALHYGSSRGQAEFVRAQCALLPQDLQDLNDRTRVLSQVFGHMHGAFAGAGSDHAGWLETADGGTLFLDEIGLLPLPLQSQLERALRSGQVRRLGETTSRPVDVRVVAASQMNLEKQVALGMFRRELLDFVDQTRLVVPPLRERPEDITPLAQQICAALHEEGRAASAELAPDILTRLQQQTLPGNGPELRRLVEEAVQQQGNT
jgi:ligand-binding sensor domain-containing protein